MITRLRTTWNGWGGAPGYTAVYLLGAPTTTGLDSAAAAMKAWMQGIAPYVPSGITLAVDNYVNRIDEKTGVVTAVDPIPTPPAAVPGAGAGGYAAPTGAVVVWRTSTVNVRRLTVGRSFLVPLTGGAYQADGTLVDATKTAIQTASQTFFTTLSGLTPGHMIVWRRPSRKGASDGAAIDATGATVNDKAQILRSRRGR